MSGPVLVTAPDSAGVARDVPAWPTGVPGLLVAEVPRESGHCAGAWAVVHARSGWRLPYCLPGRGAALGLALAVREVTDWRQHGQDVRSAMRNGPYSRAVAAYRPWRCAHGSRPREITHDNGVIA